MNDRPCIVIRVGRGGVVAAALVLAAALALVVAPGDLRAQKTQENYKEKLDITTETGGVGIATSADGKHVYVVGPTGVLVSDSYGQTGTWVQTVRLK
jgi:hypothetical protein